MNNDNGTNWIETYFDGIHVHIHERSHIPMACGPAMNLPTPMEAIQGKPRTPNINAAMLTDDDLAIFDNIRRCKESMSRISNYVYAARVGLI